MTTTTHPAHVSIPIAKVEGDSAIMAQDYQQRRANEISALGGNFPYVLTYRLDHAIGIHKDFAVCYRTLDVLVKELKNSMAMNGAHSFAVALAGVAIDITDIAEESTAPVVTAAPVDETGDLHYIAPAVADIIAPPSTPEERGENWEYDRERNVFVLTNDSNLALDLADGDYQIGYADAINGKPRQNKGSDQYQFGYSDGVMDDDAMTNDSTFLRVQLSDAQDEIIRLRAELAVAQRKAAQS